MKNARSAQTTSTAPVKRIDQRRVADLKTYPRQDVTFHPLTDAELKRLADDMQRNGLTNPVEITTADVIIDGHQRVAAARALGWTVIDVWVRDDLNDELVIDRRHIEANLHRRQLDPLDQVRLAVRLFEIERQRQPGGLLESEMTHMKAFVAQMVDKHPRHVQRFLNVIAAPMEVQRAYSAHRLGIDSAEKVCRLAPSVQATIAAEVRAGGDPAAIVQARLPQRKVKLAKPANVFGALIDELDRCMERLDGSEYKIHRTDADHDRDIAVLARFAAYSRKLIPKLRKNQADARKSINDIRDMFGTGNFDINGD